LFRSSNPSIYYVKYLYNYNPFVTIKSVRKFYSQEEKALKVQ